MSRSRLTAWIAENGLPEGEVLVLGPRATDDLSALPRDRAVLRVTDRVDHDAWTAAGWRTEGQGPFALAVVAVPRSKALARARIAEAASAAPLVWVDGQREDGVDAIWREIRDRRPDAAWLAQGHGRLVAFAGGEGFADWAMPAPVKGPDGLFRQPGVFGEGGPDGGSVLLAAALPAALPARMADLGAGVGTLAQAVLARDGVVSLDLVESERLALDAARLGITDPRARFVWADVTAAPLGPYDGIVMNPPFHRARTADPDLGRAFLDASARALVPGGRLWLVANRHLPYEADLVRLFDSAREIGGDGRFKLIEAVARRGQARPRRR